MCAIRPGTGYRLENGRAPVITAGRGARLLLATGRGARRPVRFPIAGHLSGCTDIREDGSKHMAQAIDPRQRDDYKTVIQSIAHSILQPDAQGVVRLPPNLAAAGTGGVVYARHNARGVLIIVFPTWLGTTPNSELVSNE